MGLCHARMHCFRIGLVSLFCRCLCLPSQSACLCLSLSSILFHPCLSCPLASVCFFSTSPVPVAGIFLASGVCVFSVRLPFVPLSVLVNYLCVPHFLSHLGEEYGYLRTVKLSKWLVVNLFWSSSLVLSLLFLLFS